MKPLQVWLPLFASSLADPAFERDAQRAFASWRGESRIWLLPEFTKVVRWQEGPTSYMAGVPSERLNCIDICHVGKNNHVIGLSADRFRNRSINGLLDAWLNIRKLSIHRAVHHLRLAVPHARKGKIYYQECKYALVPGPMMPITKFDGSGGKFTTGWPPASASFSTVSPEGESLAEYGPLRHTGERKGRVVRSDKTGTAAISVTLGWPEPLDTLIPPSASLDVVYGQEQMREICRLCANDPTRALALARAQSRKFVSECETSREFAWFWPTMDHSGRERIVFEAEDLGICAKDWPALRANPDFKRRLQELVPGVRVWGPLGLFWALLLERLERQSLHLCQSCGRSIQGRRSKRYCGPEDNSKCFRDRRASDTRKSRRQSARLTKLVP